MINFEFSGLDKMSHILDFVCEEPTILDLEGYVCCIWTVKNVVNMTNVFLDWVRVNDDVTRIVEARLQFVHCNNNLGGTLKGRSGVCKAKWYNNVQIGSRMRNKRCFKLVLFSIIHLPVSWVRIKRRSYFCLSEWVDTVVHVRERIAVIQCHLVHPTIVYTKA